MKRKTRAEGGLGFVMVRTWGAGLLVLGLGCSLPPRGEPAGVSTSNGSTTDTGDETGGLAICGDGVVEGDEECDLGPEETGISGSPCTPECKFNVCPDGHQGPEEACDLDGEPNRTCTPDCAQNECGDGYVGVGESCDDGNDDNTDECSNECGFVATCGNAKLDPGEDCDPSVVTPEGYAEHCTGGCAFKVGATSIMATTNHTCATLHDGSVKCWGKATTLVLGYPQFGPDEDIGDDEVPANLPPIDFGSERRAIQVSGGNKYTCVLFDDEKVRCWGSEAKGALGHGMGEDAPAVEDPALAEDLDLPPVRYIEGGELHVCAITTDDELICWGKAGAGRLGRGHTCSIGDDETPISTVACGENPNPPSDPGLPAVNVVSAGTPHTCALFTNGNVLCWGWNERSKKIDGKSVDFPGGQLGHELGDLAVGQSALPSEQGVAVDFGTAAAESLGTSRYSTCAALDDGTVRCWGSNWEGAVGVPWMDDYEEDHVGFDSPPVEAPLAELDQGWNVVGFGVGIAQDFMLVHLRKQVGDQTEDAIKCWGHNEHGECGVPFDEGDPKTPVTPAETGLIKFDQEILSVAAGMNHACVLLADSTVRCWGLGNRGRLGYGNAETLGDDASELTGLPAVQLQ